MFDNGGATAMATTSPTPTGSVELGALVGLLAGVSTEACDGELVDRIRALEELKAAVGAAQARMTVAFAASQRAAQVAAGVPARRVGQGIPAQIGLARRESPTRAAQHLGWAVVLLGELPCTFAALQAGQVSEWRAQLVARETIWLSREDRRIVDAELAGRLPGLGDGQVVAEARKIACRLDPAGQLARSRGAVKDRRVSVRPAPDTMTWLTALLPAAQGVAAWAALHKFAAAARAAGDPRSRGQVMADTLVERVTGQATADLVPVHIDLVMTERTLFGDTAVDSDTDSDYFYFRDLRDSDPDYLDHNYDDLDVDFAHGGYVDFGGDDWGYVDFRDHDAGADHDPFGLDVDDRGDLDGRDHDDTACVDVRDDVDDAEPGLVVLGDDEPADGDGSRHDDRRTREPEGHSDDSGDGGVNEPAYLIGYGPIPAGLARDLAATAVTAWVRRLYRHPDTGQLAAMDSRARTFPAAIRDALIIRDQLCRTPWCGAPIRHTDHAFSHARGGETSLENGQGLCEACNYLKEALDWHTETGPGGTSDSVTITTPTGHIYTSRPPDLPGTRHPPPAPTSKVRTARRTPHLQTTKPRS